MPTSQSKWDSQSRSLPRIEERLVSKCVKAQASNYFELHDDQGGSPHNQAAFHVDNNAEDSFMNVLITALIAPKV
jgi:hypothetical protein